MDLTILFPLGGLALFTWLLSLGYEQEAREKIISAMSDEEYFAMRREEEARKPQYDPDKDYFWRFDCWLGETLETSDKWFADPVILICILLVLVNL